MSDFTYEKIYTESTIETVIFTNYLGTTGDVLISLIVDQSDPNLPPEVINEQHVVVEGGDVEVHIEVSKPVDDIP
jgi:hypothetical protein